MANHTQMAMDAIDRLFEADAEIERLQNALKDAVTNERKRCIKIVEGLTGHSAEIIITAIRSGLPVE